MTADHEAVALERFMTARLDEAEAVAKAASGGTVVGEPGDWKPAPGGDEWEVHADLIDTDHYGRDGDLEVLVALRPGLPRPPEPRSGYWGVVVSWQRDYSDRDAWIPEPQFRHMALHDPAAALRSIAADRCLLAELARCEGDPGWDSALMLAVRCRATAWDTHPDYLDRWKP